MEVNAIKLENNEEYLIIDTIEIENNKYLILVNAEKNYDICVRKVVLKNSEEVLIKLASEEEFERVMTVFNQKHVREETSGDEK